MKLKRQVLMFLLMMAAGSAGSCLFSQSDQQKPTRQSSMDAFSEGNFEQAYNGFSQMLQTYSKDPIYKYYKGACLVELQRSPSEALQLIEQSLQTATVVRPLPSEARYYLGRAQQMSGKYNEAIKSYKLFIEEAGKKVSKGKGTEALIQQCKEGKGEIKEVPVVSTEKKKPDSIPVTGAGKKTETIASVPATVPAIVPAIVPAAVPSTVPSTTAVDPSGPAKSKAFSYEKLIDQGMESQVLADSLHDLTAKLRKDLEMLPDAQKSDIQKKIDENEKLEAEYQKSADQKFEDAKAVSTSVQIKPKETSVVNQPAASGVAVAATIQEKPKEAAVVNQSVAPVVAVSAPIPEKPKEAAAVKASVELYSLFEILPGPDQAQASKQSGEKGLRMNYHFNGKDWWDPQAKITIDPPVGTGLIYRIQMAVFRNPVKPSFFKGIAPVYGFKIAGTDKTIYYAGMFRKLADANKALASVKAKGFADAFVIPLSDNKRVPAEKAAAMEKEWSKTPFISAAEAPGSQQQILDTIPPSLSFRVEVVKTQKPLKEDAVEGMKKIAGNRGVDIQTFDNGSCAYLIGKFITFESASEYSDLLIKNGYREARVVAFLGIKEIPVETAKQLFENLK
jgi:tetratricopeptide (TPR) repeat protein